MISAPNSPSAVATIGPAASVAASTTRRPCERAGLAVGHGALTGGRARPRCSRKVEPLYLLAEHATRLQLGHHQPNHVLVRAGHMRGGDDETVARVAVEPLLHLVGHGGRRSDEPRPLQQRGAVAGEIGERDGVADVLAKVAAPTRECRTPTR